MNMRRTSVCLVIAVITVLVNMCAIAETIGEITPSVMDMTTGGLHVLIEIFIDPEAAVAAMENIAVRDMEENGNAYLENRDVAPLPVDRLEADAYGITVRYPSDRLSTFSGRPGAYHFFWYELDGLYDPAFVEGLKERAAGAAVSGDTRVMLPGLPVALNDELDRLSMMFGGGKESDFTSDAQVYHLEDAKFRGVTVLTGRDDAAGTGAVIEIRAGRLDYNGLCVGITQSDDVIDVMGESIMIEDIDEDVSYYSLLPEGRVYWYDVDGGRLGMLINKSDTLEMVILRKAADEH